MDEGINSLVETIKELEAENEKLKFRLSNVMQQRELLKAYTKWLRQNNHLQSSPFPSLIDQYLASL